MPRVLSKSLVRRLKVQMEPQELAAFLAATVDAGVLKRATELASQSEDRQPADIYVHGDGQAGWSVALVKHHHVLGTNQGIVPAHEPQTEAVAQYRALVAGLLWAGRLDRPVTVHIDSHLVYGQLVQDRRVEGDHLRHLWEEASQLLDETGARLVKEPRERMAAVLSQEQGPGGAEEAETGCANSE